MKKILITFLFVIAFGNLRAQFAGGNGSETNPYIISTAAQLDYMARKVKDDNANYGALHYRLSANLPNVGILYEGLRIGTSAAPFKGTFDGAGYTIFSLFNDDETDHDGLFGYVAGASIKNVKIKGARPCGTYSGGIIGYAVGGTVIENCSVEGDFSTRTFPNTAVFLGGLIGYADGATVKNCSFKGDLTPTYTDLPNASYSGGLIGYANNVEVIDCFAEANIKGSNIGGFIGRLTGVSTIQRCNYKGSIFGTFQIGGFIAQTEGNATITGCMASATVIGLSESSAGGFIASFNARGEVSGCIAEGTVISGDAAGGFFVYLTAGASTTISDCRSTGYIEGDYMCGGFAAYMNINSSSTVTRCSSERQVTGKNSTGGFVGYVYVSGATSTRVVISECYAYGAIKGNNYVGGFAGSLRYCNFSNCYAVCTVEGGSQVGGFAGRTQTGYDSSFTGCYASGTVSADEHVGGFIGYSDGNHTFANCYSTATVFGETGSGGFVGYNRSPGSGSTFTNCYYDLQMATQESAFGVNIGTIFEPDNIEGLTTSALTDPNFSGFGGDDRWVFSLLGVERSYPSLKVFANSIDLKISSLSQLSTTPFKLANDTETVDNVQTVITIPEIIGKGRNEIEWLVNPGENVAIVDNVIYAEPSPEWRTLTLRSEGVERIVKFRTPNGMLSTGILSATVNKIYFDNIVSPFIYPIECGSRDESVFMEFRIPPYCESEPESPVTLYANQPLEIAVTDVNGNTETYTFEAKKPLSSGIFIQRWADRLEINDNPSTNGGYEFTGYEWYKNGAKLSETKSYICEPDGFNSTDIYAAVVTTNEGDKLDVCPAVTSEYLAAKSTDFFVQRHDDVLTVNNDFMTNGGYNFTAYGWYKDNVLLPGNNGYYHEQGGLSKSAKYTVMLTTQQGDKFGVCPAEISDYVNTEMLSATINKVPYDNIVSPFNYSLECGSRDESVFMEYRIPPYCTSAPESPVTFYANQPLEITVTDVNGKTETYTFEAKKSLSSGIIMQRWSDKLEINDNPATNGGYNFKGYEWYRNGVKLSETKGYICNPDGFNSTDIYTAVLTTQQGDKLNVCPAVTFSSDIAAKSSEIFIQRWNDVLAINNNFLTNGGYNFVEYEWYKDNVLQSCDKGYYYEKGGLSKTAKYTVMLTTQQGERFASCPAEISDVKPTMAVYPNPVLRGQTVRVETEIATNAVMQLFDVAGNIITKKILQNPLSEIIAPDVAGTYILKITKNGESQSIKIVVE